MMMSCVFNVVDFSSHYSPHLHLHLHLHAHSQITPPLLSKRAINRFWNCNSDSINHQTPRFVKMQSNITSNSIPTPIHTFDSELNKIPHVLTVAGSDSGAGAGIQADLKTCSARRVYCSTVITAVTAQNTLGVQGVNIVPHDFVQHQLNSVLSDINVDVVKTGMLPSLSVLKVLCQSLRKFPVKGSSCG